MGIVIFMAKDIMNVIQIDEELDAEYEERDMTSL